MAFWNGLELPRLKSSAVGGLCDYCCHLSHRVTQRLFGSLFGFTLMTHVGDGAVWETDSCHTVDTQTLDIVHCGNRSNMFHTVFFIRHHLKCFEA